MKTLLVDLDGVLNTYVGNYDPNYIPPIREGAKNFLEELVQNDCEIKIFTTRDKKLSEKWIAENQLQNLVVCVTNHKDPSYLIIDDRCLTFNGDYNKTINEIKNFKPWFKKA